MLSEKTSKIINYILLGISGLVVLLFYLNVLSTDTLFYWCYILLGLGVLAAIVSPIMQMIDSPKKAINASIGVVGLIVVFIISYLLADAKVLPSYASKATPSVAKWVSSGLICFYIMAIISIVAVLYVEVAKFFK